MLESFLWALRGFPDPEEERDFRQFYDRDTAVLARIAISLSLCAWSIFVVVCFVIFPAAANRVLLVVGLVLFPVFAAQILATFSPRFYGQLQYFSLAANAVAGWVTIYLGAALVHNAALGAFAMTLLCIFAFLLLRLRFVIGTISTLVFLIPYQALLLTSPHYHFQERVTASFSIWTAELFALAGGFALEKISRDLYRKTRTIEDQQRKLEIERAKSDRLLYNMLPAGIADRLKNGEQTIADHHQSVSILFADIVGFTSLSARLRPELIVQLLGDIFLCFDALVEEARAEKIKTIGDAYMVVAGLGGEDSEHARTLTALGQRMVSSIRELSAQRHDRELDIRIGIHSGPVVAGVIGKSKFLYDIWGDTVNTASRMESHGVAGRVQVSAETEALLRGHYQLEARGPIEVKGKGALHTYLVNF